MSQAPSQVARCGEETLGITRLPATDASDVQVTELLGEPEVFVAHSFISRSDGMVRGNEC